MARKMKDSGIEWIGEIPEGWEVHRMKSCISQRDGGTWGDEATGETGDCICLRIADFDYEHFRFTDSNNLTIRHYASPIIKKLLLQKNDILIEKSGGGEKTPVGRTVLFDKEYPALFANFMDRLRCSDFILPQYLQYVFVTFYKNRYTQNYIKQTTGIQNLDLSSMLADEFVPVPNLNEQKLIVCYLESKCSKIDNLLSKIRSSIEEYKKLKQAVITQAVTKGVRGEREMKDSGVEWIGEIPKEWRKTQLRHCATIKSGITLGKSYSKDTVLIERPYLRVANVQGGYVDLNDLATIEVTPDEDLKYRLHSGDVLMTEGGDRDKLGRGCVWHGEIEPCLHQNHVFAVQTNETILLPEFLEYLTASDVGRSYFDVTAIKTTNLACTSSSKVLAFTIPLPPIEEQIEIVGFIKKRSLELNKLIMKKELLVQELERYKKSLIYEVVTGKREV